MRRYVRWHIAPYISCFYNKESAGKKPGLLHLVDKVPELIHTIHIDHLGPFVRSTAKSAYLIMAVDAFTKFLFMKAIANTKALLVERLLNEIPENFGYPKE